MWHEHFLVPSRSRSSDVHGVNDDEKLHMARIMFTNRLGYSDISSTQLPGKVDGESSETPEKGVSFHILTGSPQVGRSPALMLEDHEFTEGKIHGDGIAVEIDNVCAYWKDEKLQCIKSRIAHPVLSREPLKQQESHTASKIRSSNQGSTLS